MTNPQLRALLRSGIRQMTRQTARIRRMHQDPRTRRITPSAVALEVAKAEMWVAKARVGLGKVVRKRVAL